MEGINNLGATCAINSLIQIICRCDKLRNFILNVNIPNDTFTYEFKEILDLMYNQNKSINPVKFLNYFYKTFKEIFNKNEEIDINELWFYFYEKINEETSYPILINNDINDINDIYQEHDKKISIFNNNKESELTKLVQGSYINIIQCSFCNNKTYSFEPFISIPLDINDNKNSIIDLIVDYMKNEYREKDGWKCEKCNCNHPYIITRRIWKIPKILFICLNRFNDINKKNNTNILINDTIIFNKGSIISNNEDYKYNLQGVGLHYGDLSCGHYTALCNMKNGLYNLYNDDKVNIIKKEELLPDFKSVNAYLIVYEKD